MSKPFLSQDISLGFSDKLRNSTEWLSKRICQFWKLEAIPVAAVLFETIAGQLVPFSEPNVDGFQYNVYIRSQVEKLQQLRSSFKGRTA